MNIHIVCRNWRDDRVLPRFVRYLVKHNGWTVSADPNPSADLNYMVAYFEHDKHARFTGTPIATYLTHIEDDPNSGKVKAFHKSASRADIRVCMNEMYRMRVEAKHGPTLRFPLPLERDRFTIASRRPGGAPVIGFSGFTYKSGRKGEAMSYRLICKFAKRATFKASGRGWSCPTQTYKWAEMPTFYQSLDLFVCTSTVEGGPMTTLEALACGVPVVIPSGVGLHDELPDVAGIYRYQKGDYVSLEKAVSSALSELATVDRKALRNATHPHSVEAWCQANEDAFARYLRRNEAITYDKPQIQQIKLKDGEYGIYCVAFGLPSRLCARRLVDTIHANMPGVPVAVVSDKALGNEDIPIQFRDADIGGRIAKLSVYDLAPQEWKSVLYLDADIEVTKDDPRVYFDWLADGWEFVICKDAHLKDTMKDFARRNNTEEYARTINQLGTTDALQINGGVWGFRRCKRTKAFFRRWLDEWNVHKGRDQGAFIRALYTEPLRVLWLCNEWNTLITWKGQEYPPGIKGSAGVLHFVGRARRWEGQVPTGKGLTDPEAWAMVDKFLAAHPTGRAKR
jgi:hypothetical protein